MKKLIMKAIILAAGIGERLLPLTKDIPKGLLKIKEKTVLECQMVNDFNPSRPFYFEERAKGRDAL